MFKQLGFRKSFNNLATGGIMEIIGQIFIAVGIILAIIGDVMIIIQAFKHHFCGD